MEIVVLSVSSGRVVSSCLGLSFDVVFQMDFLLFRFVVENENVHCTDVDDKLISDSSEKQGMPRRQSQFSASCCL